MEIVFIILSVLAVGLGVVVWNLLRKVEKYEEDILLKDEFIEKFKYLVDSASSRLHQIDINGAFESDDEVGYFFKNLKDITLSLDVYFKNYLVENEDIPAK
jgi:hypothetical protein